MPNSQLIQKQIIFAAKKIGFSQVGFTDTNLSRYHSKFTHYLRKKHHGKMQYMQKNIKKRLNPNQLIPYVKTIISVSMDYLPERLNQSQNILNQPHKGYIARYALGKDYHKIMRKRLKQLAQEIEKIIKPHQYRVFSDSAPVLEKAIAEKSGLGWIGKHTNLISYRQGSYFFLGEIMTDLKLPHTQPIQTNHCANCNLCIKSCPTQAIIAPYQLDASKCISYLTIELKGAIPKALRKMIGNRIYGCDDCQIVCPWNKFATLSKEVKFHAKQKLDHQTLVDLFSWNEKEFEEKTKGSPIKRIGYQRWIRNIAISLGNAPKNSDIIQALKQKSNFYDPMVREHIIWAIKQQTQ